MPPRLLHGRRAVAIPVSVVFVMIVAFAVGQARLTACGGGPCPRPGVAALFMADTALRLDAAGRPRIAPPSASLPPDSARKEYERREVAMLTVAARRHGGHLLWLLMTAAGSVGALLAWAVALLLLTRSPGEEQGRYRVRLAAVALPALALGAVMYLEPDTHMKLMSELVSGSVEARQAALSVAGAARVMTGSNAFDAAASLALVLACALLLWPARLRPAPLPSDPADRLRAELRPLFHRLHNLRLFLYVSTVLLVVGVLRMQVVMDWVLTFVKPAHAVPLGEISVTLRTVLSTFYSLLLAGTYLPCAAILRARAREAITAAPVPPEVRDQLRSDPALRDSFTTLLPRIAALVGPLLAGPLAGLLQGL